MSPGRARRKPVRVVATRMNETTRRDLRSPARTSSRADAARITRGDRREDDPLLGVTDPTDEGQPAQDRAPQWGHRSQRGDRPEYRDDDPRPGGPPASDARGQGERCQERSGINRCDEGITGLSWVRAF